LRSYSQYTFSGITWATQFPQPDAARTDGGYLLPFHMDSSKVNAQNAGELDHSWAGDHSARNGGAWNNWVPAKTEQTMGYFTRADIPQTFSVGSRPQTVDWPAAAHGYYDVIVTASSSDGFTRRYAGRIA
jgi:phospholipase C